MGDDDEEVIEQLEDVVQELGDDGGESSEPPPLQALANRYRLPLGVVIAVVMATFFIWSLMSMESATVPGVFGIVQRFAFPAICVLIAAVGLTWGLRLKSLWTNIAAYATILVYLLYVLTGWVYERFIIG